jgi:Pro-kumamolisin, activation domain/Divergent InlB B-repeat domain
MQRFRECRFVNRRSGPTFGRLGVAGAVLALLVLGVALRPSAYAQTAAVNHAQPLITAPISETNRLTLSGNTRPEARNPANDRGRVADTLPMQHMQLQLRRPAAQEQALQTLIDQLHDPASPNYHHWLNSGELGAQFGPAASDVTTITAWLEQHGFTVNSVSADRMTIDFSGTAGQVRAAFQTEIHNLTVNGAAHIANMTDPAIPAALAPVVVGIVALTDFRPHPLAVHKSQAAPDFTTGGSYYVSPPDLETIYNFNPLFNAGNSGQGQTIYLIEDTDLYSTSDWTTFRAGFGLAGFTSGSLTTVHPAPASGTTNCSDPGVNANGDDAEAIIDAEYASAAAPSAAIVMATCSDAADGILIAVQNLVNNSTTPAIMSISYGDCEADNGAASNAAYKTAYQTGVAKGWSIFVSAGDQGAGGCDYGTTVTHGIGISGLASTPYNVAVGGTDFSDTYSGTNSTYWNSSNTASNGSAKSYVPEIPWNTTCGSQLYATSQGFGTTYGSSGFCNSAINSFYRENWAGSGGPSACATGSPATSDIVSGSCAGYAKPSWQSGLFGNPADGVRDIPDVSMFASFGPWNHSYVICYSDTSQQGGVACDGTASGWSYGWAGTSFGAPIWAGIQALVNQYTGALQGNPNPILYKLAATEYGASGSSSCNSSNGNSAGSSCIFYDVTLGDNDVPCRSSRQIFYNCYDPSGTYGVLSTNNNAYAPAYPTAAGWDFATGIGTVNVFNLATHWASGGGNVALTVSVTGSGTVTSSPSGISCPSTCSVTYAGATNVTLTAAPSSGAIFSGWGGACSSFGTSTNCTVQVNAAQSVAATFTQTFALSVIDSGSGSVTSSPTGINCGSTCSASFASGTQVTLNETPASGWNFSGWSGACSGSGSCMVTMSSAKSVTATFTQITYLLSVGVSGSGTVTSSPSGINCGSTCNASFNSGTQVTLNEAPGSGYSFSGWSGACGGTGSCMVTMSAAESVTATFTSSGGSGSPTSILYVNPELGTDIGACPQTAPCQTLNYALSQAASGSVIEIEAGGVFGPIYISQPITINGPADGSTSIAWSSTQPGCVGAGVGTCNGGGNANYAVEIAAGTTNNPIIALSNILIDNGSGTNGAVHVASAFNVSFKDVVLRGGSGAIAQIMLVDSSQGSQLQLYFSNCDIGFSASGGGLLVAPVSTTPVNAQFQGGEVHNGLFGLTFDASGLTAGTKIQAEVDNSKMFSFNNSAVTAKAASGGSVKALLSRSTIENTGSSAFSVNGGNAVGLLFRDTITANQVGVAASNGGTVYSFGNNDIFGNSTNVSGSLTAAPSQ